MPRQDWGPANLLAGYAGTKILVSVVQFRPRPPIPTRLIAVNPPRAASGIVSSMPRPIDSMSLFLAHALAIEREAAERYAEFGAWYAERGEEVLAGMCRELCAAEHSHYEALLRASQGVQLSPLRTGEYHWLEAGTPEAPARDAFLRIATPAQLLTVALEAERRARRFFGWVARTTRDKAVRAMAREMATEEARHVAWLERALAYRDPLGQSAGVLASPESAAL